MNTLIIGNRTIEEQNAEILRAAKTGKPAAAARIDFERLEDGWKILSENRRAILRVMARAGPLGIREVARRVKRDVRAVHSDLTMLHRNGVIDKTEAGLLLMPYDVIRLDFTLDATHAA
jgi:predicted transcriptional regulator